MDFYYVWLFLSVAMVTVPVKCKPISVRDPKVKELADYSLLKIGDGAELVKITSADVQEVPALKYTLTMLVYTYSLDRYETTKILKECTIQIVDGLDLRWVTAVDCNVLDIEWV